MTTPRKMKKGMASNGKPCVMLTSRRMKVSGCVPSTITKKDSAAMEMENATGMSAANKPSITAAGIQFIVSIRLAISARAECFRKSGDLVQEHKGEAYRRARVDITK